MNIHPLTVPHSERSGVGSERETKPRMFESLVDLFRPDPSLRSGLAMAQSCGELGEFTENVTGL